MSFPYKRENMECDWENAYNDLILKRYILQTIKWQFNSLKFQYKIHQTDFLAKSFGGMYATEKTLSDLPNPNPNPYPTLTPIPSSTPATPSTVHLRQLGERCEYNEQVMPPPSRLDQPEQEQELEDLRAFERRLQELADANKPSSFHWVPILGTMVVCTAISACHWLPGVRESQSIMLRSLSSRGALTLSLATIVLTIFFGARQVTKSSGQMVLSEDTMALFQLQCGSNDLLDRSLQ